MQFVWIVRRKITPAFWSEGDFLRSCYLWTEPLVDRSCYRWQENKPIFDEKKKHSKAYWVLIRTVESNTVIFPLFAILFSYIRYVRFKQKTSGSKPQKLCRSVKIASNISSKKVLQFFSFELWYRLPFIFAYCTFWIKFRHVNLSYTKINLRLLCFDY